MSEQREFDGMPTAGITKHRKWSKHWNQEQMEEFKALCREHDGLTPPLFAAVILGVSRQRVYQLMKEGRLTTYEVLGRFWLGVDEVEAFATLDRDASFRYREPSLLA